MVIVEGYREAGKVKQRTVCNLGFIDDEENKQNILSLGAKLLKQFGASALIDGSELEEESRQNWGMYELLAKLWEHYSLDKYFDKLLESRKIEYNLQDAIKLMLAGRLCNPSSKLALYERQEFYEYYAGYSKLELHHLYRALDELSKCQDELNVHLFDAQRAINGISHITFFDVTTLYFESQKVSDLQDFGFSKDCKFNEVQIMLSLLTDDRGHPLACEIFKGNTYEGNSLGSCINKLKEKYKIKEAIIVADRGLYSKSNLELIQSNGFKYIVGSRLKNSNKDIKNAVFADDGYVTTEYVDNDDVMRFKYKLISNEQAENYKENIIIAWSEKRAMKDARDRKRLIEKAKDLVANGTVNDKRGAKKYIKIVSKDAELDEAKIELDANWDGYYGISTNSDLSAKEVIAAYHDLWRIEDSFRLMKNYFETRPIFHWTKKRIIGHITLNFIAMVFERYIEQLVTVEDNGDGAVSPNKIRASINNMQRSIVNVDGNRFYHYAKLNDLGKMILSKLSIPIPKSRKLV